MPSLNDHASLPITVPLVTVAMMFLLYGSYIVLFGICVVALLKNKRKERLRIHLFAIGLLFLLATVGLMINTTSVALRPNDTKEDSFTMLLNDLLGSDIGITGLYFFIIANIVADCILLWRCYIVWGSRVKIVMVPAILCALNNLLAIITIAISAKNNSIILLTIGLLNFGEVFVIVNIFTNALVTLLIAGRIFWISHQLRAVLGRNVMNMYRTIIAITLESGIIYPIILSLFGATRATVAANVLYYSLIQVVGIAPTLIVVRIQLGVSIQDVSDHGVSTRPTMTTQSPGTSTRRLRRFSSRESCLERDSDVILDIRQKDASSSLMNVPCS